MCNSCALVRGRTATRIWNQNNREARRMLIKGGRRIVSATHEKDEILDAAPTAKSEAAKPAKGVEAVEEKGRIAR